MVIHEKIAQLSHHTKHTLFVNSSSKLMTVGASQLTVDVADVAPPSCCRTAFSSVQT
jgi:hypothetical protein